MVINLNQKFSNYVKLSKLRVIELLLVTTVPSMIIAIYGMPPVNLVLYTLAGGTLLAISANVMNQVFEVSRDSLMDRTSDRPLVTGELTKVNAISYSVVCGISGFLILYFFTTQLAALIGLLANLFYTFIYTLLLKPRTNQNIVIGGAAGALPPIIGWTIATNSISLEPISLFFIIFF